MKEKILKSILSLILIFSLLTPSVNYVLAEDLVAPAPPSAPSAPEAPSQPTAPTAPDTPTAPSAPSAPSPTTTDNIIDTTEPTGADTEQPALTSSTPTNQNSTGQQADGNVGNTQLTTGDAANTATVTTTGNDSISLNPQTGDGSSIINSDNGTDSNNSSTVNNNDTNTATQANSANVNNSLNQSTTTGLNTASDNIGNSQVQTGDANTTGTVITAVNTNTAGVSVSEFNVVDNHVGDLVLNFDQNCVSGCNTATSSAQNTNNGTGSDNTAITNSNTDNFTAQTNDAVVGSNLSLNSNSGDNKASRNTGGDSTITTGDANVNGNVATFLNNNITGQVVLGIVNIFGNLIGDIILPDNTASCTSCGSSNATQNTANGSDSTNNATTSQNTNSATFQTNSASIENNVSLTAQTGLNDTSRNTGGNSSVITGNADVQSQTLNVANTNIDGGDIWLVIVNQAGEWVGMILGAPSGSTFAGSTGTDFQVGPNGDITATNSGNGSGSQNTSQVNQNSNTTTVQDNNAKVVNNVDLSANTGGNRANDNTGGDSIITTGDAKAIANLINFVNNNVTGNGRLIVTVVNVFGTWLGDFVTPGSKKEDAPQVASANTNQPQQTSNDNTATSTEATTTNNTQNPSSADQTNSKSTESNSPIFYQITSTIKNGGGAVQVLGNKTSLLLGNKIGSVDLNKVITKDQSTGKTLSINLAWLVMLLPLVVLLIILRKLVFKLKRSHGN